MNHHPHRFLTGWPRFALPLLAGLLGSAVGVRPAAAAGAVIKVSCIGEQTTHSDLFPSRTNQPVGMQEYPAMLQTLLGAGYNVMNYGDCCASVISGYTAPETHPYINGNQFGPSTSFTPDIVVIGSWGRHDWGKSAQTALAAFTAGDTMTTFTKFQTDYDTLVSKYIALANKPKIFCSTPIPIPFGMDGPDDGYKTSPAAAAITAVCQKYNLPIIDLFTAFTGHMEFYINPPLKDSDGEHTSPVGAMEIAQLTYDAIMGLDGGILAGGSGGGSDGGSGGGSGGGSKPDAAAGGGGNSSSSGGGSGGGGGMASTSSSSGTSGGTASGSGTTGGGSGSAPGSSSGSGTAGSITTGSSSGVDPGSSSGAGAGGAAGISTAAPSTSGESSGHGGGCSTAVGSRAQAPWSIAFFAFVGLGLLSRRRTSSAAGPDKTPSPTSRDQTRT